ncbi:MAG: hypothetical protein LBP33_07635 [Candidatus Adiutrix sp.]|nr:hypothetical protein [Candidatus Adiutrix sp.]
MNRLPAVLAALGRDNVGLPKKHKPRFDGQVVIGWAEIDGVSYGLTMEIVKADRAIVGTFFKDKPKNIENWVRQMVDKEKAVTAPAALWHARVPKGNEFRDQPSIDNIAPQGDKGKRLSGLSSRPSAPAPHRYDRPSLSAIGTGEGVQVHGWGRNPTRGGEIIQRAKSLPARHRNPTRVREIGRKLAVLNRD